MAKFPLVKKIVLRVTTSAKRTQLMALYTRRTGAGSWVKRKITFTDVTSAKCHQGLCRRGCIEWNSTQGWNSIASTWEFVRWERQLYVDIANANLRRDVHTLSVNLNVSAHSLISPSATLPSSL